MKEKARSTFLLFIFCCSSLSRHEFRVPDEHLRFNKEVAIWWPLVAVSMTVYSVIIQVPCTFYSLLPLVSGLMMIKEGHVLG